MENPSTRERELRALEGAVTTVKVENALILTDKNEDSFEIKGLRVDVRSMAEWLLLQK